MQKHQAVKHWIATEMFLELGLRMTCPDPVQIRQPGSVRNLTLMNYVGIELLCWVVSSCRDTVSHILANNLNNL